MYSKNPNGHLLYSKSPIRAFTVEYRDMETVSIPKFRDHHPWLRNFEIITLMVSKFWSHYPIGLEISESAP